MISIITVNWNSYDFLELLLESLQQFSKLKHNIIIVDNSTKTKNIFETNVHQFFMSENIGHGKGLNYGTTKALELYPENLYLLFLDVDCHLLCHNWDEFFVEELENYDLVGAPGVSCKPIRPACMFMKKKLGHFDWSDTPGYQGHRITPDGFDVAIQAYYKIKESGYKINFLKSFENRYQTLNGEMWGIKDTPLIYHHWHGSHLKERSVDFPNQNLMQDKQNLFNQIPWRLP